MGKIGPLIVSLISKSDSFNFLQWIKTVVEYKSKTNKEVDPFAVIHENICSSIKSQLKSEKCLMKSCNNINNEALLTFLRQKNIVPLFGSCITFLFQPFHL